MCVPNLPTPPSSTENSSEQFKQARFAERIRTTIAQVNTVETRPLVNKTGCKPKLQRSYSEYTERHVGKEYRSSSESGYGTSGPKSSVSSDRGRVSCQTCGHMVEEEEVEEDVFEDNPI